jgi:hypothetical protein
MRPKPLIATLTAMVVISVDRLDHRQKCRQSPRMKSTRHALASEIRGISKSAENRWICPEKSA